MGRFQMLVYSSNLTLVSADSPKQIIELIARWIGKRAGGSISPDELAQGVKRKRMKDGSTVTSHTTRTDPAATDFPMIFSAEFSHRDEQVSGRLWTTGIGLRQFTANGTVECTFLLKTDEVSTRVSSPIQVTRPRIVLDVVAHCQLAANTPGVKVKQLNEASANAFLAEVERLDRSNPIVVISARRDGTYIVQPERMRSLLVGIADVVEISAEADTFEIERILGKKYGAWGGAVNVLYRSKAGRKGAHCNNSLYRPDRLDDLLEASVNLESEILAAVTHQTNVPTSWRHISLHVVDQAILHNRLESALERAKQTNDGAEYIELLEDAMNQMTAKDNSIDELRTEVEEQEERISALEANIQSLKHSLTGIRQAAVAADDESLEAIIPLRDAVSMLVEGNPTPDQSLTIIQTLFPDRIVILPSASSSANESNLFRYPSKAFTLLWKLATSYWTALSIGDGDAEGRKVFGQNGFAQNEGSALSNDGKKRRTFEYKGQDILMEKHLKIGVKDSAAETIRIHFAWVAADNAIVIGHCGKHLDF